MPRPDAFADPNDPTNLDPVDRHTVVPPESYLAHHPYVRHLQREVAALRETVKVMAATQREMFNRTLVAGRFLEPVNPAPLGTIDPVDGEPTIVHVDNLRLMANRVRGEEEPTIRILAGGLAATPQHAHWVQLGASELRERPIALPGRSGAHVVLHTREPLTVIR